ncbi:MAG: hypothetical protein AAGA18_07620 [Verrucomicrobiota bacterium]
MIRVIFCLLALKLLLAQALLGNNVIEELSSFSKIKKLDLPRVLDGKIEGTKMTLPNHELGIGTEALFVVPASPDQILDHIANFDASTKTEAGNKFDLEAHYSISVPPRLQDFSGFKLDSRNKASKWLMIQSSREARKSDLNLSNKEFKSLYELTESLKETHGKSWMIHGEDALALKWQEIFYNRALQYQNGALAGSQPYYKVSQEFEIDLEMATMLGGNPQVQEHFKRLIHKAFLGDQDAKYYWEQAKVNGRQTVNLGVFLKDVSKGNYKALEAQYYVTSTYFNSMTLYQMWPLENEETLVWRGDYVISSAFRILKGIQRIAARNVMLLEVKKSVKAFVKDFQKNELAASD